jgi:hypothetical protein
VFTPHLTIYQVPVKLEDMDELHRGLAATAAKASASPLAATEYGDNASEASFEIRYEPASWLMQLQDEVLAVVNPLRGTFCWSGIPPAIS